MRPNSEDYLIIDNQYVRRLETQILNMTIELNQVKLSRDKKVIDHELAISELEFEKKKNKLLQIRMEILEKNSFEMNEINK